ncbi:MAG: glycosyltransferase family 2 protein [Acidimicrobiia bacterium]
MDEPPSNGPNGRTEPDADRSMPTDRPVATVVIPARNEEAWIGACLDSIVSQDERRLQILVVDGASTDRTPEIVKEYSARDGRVTLLSNPDRIIPRSLNIALREASAPWLVRVDAHASIPSDYVGRAVDHLRSGRWGGVGGRKDGVGVTPAGRAIAAAMASPFGVGNSTYHYGSEATTVEHIPFGAYPVDLARRLGGWDERLRVNQDFEFDYRVRLAGGELLFDPDLRIQWFCRQSVPELFRQYRRYGEGKVSVAVLHPLSLRLRHLAAPALVFSWAVSALLARRHPAWAATLVAPYAGALAVATQRTARTLADPQDRKWVAPAFAAMHTGWGVGFWRGVARVARSRARGLRQSPGSDADVKTSA